jgi:excisionase family DNA binding protein
MATAAAHRDDSYLTLQQIVSRNLGAYSTLRSRIASGELPAVRLGNRYLVREADLVAMLKPVMPKPQDQPED